MHVGWRRFRAAAVPIGILGVLGTFATAGVLAVVAHVVLGLEWTTAFLLGAALAPTDPAVMFSVLGNREVRGRSGTILEGESGANDPVGIALVLGRDRVRHERRRVGVGDRRRSSSSRWRSACSSASSAEPCSSG